MFGAQQFKSALLVKLPGRLVDSLRHHAQLGAPLMPGLLLGHLH